MTTTVQNIIESALGKIGVRAVGQTISDAILAFCLASIDELREMLATDNYLIYCYTEQSQLLVSGQASYGIGSTGDWAITRPQAIHPSAFVRDSGDSDYEVTQIPLQQYRDKASKTDPGRPCEFAYNPTYPNGTMYVYPVPTSVETFKFRTLDELTAFTSLSQELNLPPGYRPALVANLAVYVAPDFGRNPTPTLLNLAKSTKEGLRARNSAISEPTKLEVAGLSTGAGGNILSGWGQ